MRTASEFLKRYDREIDGSFVKASHSLLDGVLQGVLEKSKEKIPYEIYKNMIRLAILQAIDMQANT